MRHILIFIIVFLPSYVFSDDISDYQIENITVGDSLLDYYSENTIEKNIDPFLLEYRKDETYYTVEITDKDFKEYELLQFGLRDNDPKYIIYSLAGANFYKNISKCHKRMDSIIKEISDLLKFTDKKDYGTYPHPADPSGKSYVKTFYFDFEEDQGKGMDHIAIGCTDWSNEFEKSYNYQDNLRVVIQTAEYDFWLNNLAY